VVLALHVLSRLCDIEEELREPPLRGDVVLEARAEGGVAQRVGQALSERLPRARVVGEAQEAADDVLEEPRGRLLDESAHEVGKDGGHGVESLGGRTDVGEARLVKQDLLHNERRDLGSGGGGGGGGGGGATGGGGDGEGEGSE
jgi:hypothetical protein